MGSNWALSNRVMLASHLAHPNVEPLLAAERPVDSTIGRARTKGDPHPPVAHILQQGLTYYDHVQWFITNLPLPIEVQVGGITCPCPLGFNSEDEPALTHWGSIRR